MNWIFTQTFLKAGNAYQTTNEHVCPSSSCQTKRLKASSLQIYSPVGTIDYSSAVNCGIGRNLQKRNVGSCDLMPRSKLLGTQEYLTSMCSWGGNARVGRPFKSIFPSRSTFFSEFPDVLNTLKLEIYEFLVVLNAAINCQLSRRVEVGGPHVIA